MRLSASPVLTSFSWFRTSFAAVLIAWLHFHAMAAVQAVETLEMEVSEPAGLVRRGFPTHLRLKLPRVVSVSTKFRLVSDGKPVVAQFRPEGGQSTADWWLDFQSDLIPNQTKRFQIEFGPDVVELPELTRGHELTRSDDGFSIAHAPYISWKFPADLKGFLPSVAFEAFEFMKTDSPGLILRDRQSNEYAFSGTGRIIRQGHMAVALRYEKAQTEANLPEVHSTVDLTLPGPVSWVEVEWTILDPGDNIAAAGLKLNLNLDQSDKAPTIVDFGASSCVYLSLYPGQEAELVANALATNSDSNDLPRWEIIRRDPGRVWPFAAQSKRSKNYEIEGWAHVMDRKKCLALAIDSFARDTSDRINITADGKIAIWREYPFSTKPTRKKLRFWLHFVFFPPQVSASTSPQQMQTPLEVRFLGP